MSRITSFLAVSAGAALLSGGLAVPARAQFNYPDFSSTGGLNLVGNAAQVGNVLRLTPSAPGQQGSAWRTNVQNAMGGFTTTFKFKVTALSNGNLGADGISFSINNECPTISFGERGGGGEGYAKKGLTVAFDMYPNGGPEPSDNFVGVIQNGGLVATQDLNGLGIRMQDTNEHTVNITLDGAGNLTVRIDSTTVLTMGGVSIAAPGYVGLGARTGGLWENHDITSWSFTPTAGGPLPQNINYSDFFSLAGLALAGDAKHDPLGTSLRLTDPVGGQTGGAFFVTKQDVHGDWECNFDFLITGMDRFGNPTRGADGFSFNINDCLGGARSEDGGLNGESVSPDGLVVSFDMYDNDDAGPIEPSDNFVEIFQNGVSLGQYDMYASGILMCDSQVHHVRITHNTANELAVFMDDRPVIVAADVALCDGYVGFGGRTGGAWEAHDIQNWTLTPGGPRWDINNDGATDDLDLGVVLSQQGKCEGDPGFSADADVNCDGCVDDLDLGIVLAHQGE